MAFSTGSSGGSAPMADMNVTPLVDVMLVLLIIFMVTAPAMTFQIQIDLPQPVKDLKPPERDPPEPIRLKIDAGGQLFWNDMPMPRNALGPSLMIEAARDVQPTLELDTSPEVQYQVLTEVLAEAKNANMKKIGFVEDSNQY
ncbi:MAG: biopolymer transporter ExbD [Xanthomonadales bacterium]|nr:biopolymer transporter ExbD [Xanthomonadales bacterium]